MLLSISIFQHDRLYLCLLKEILLTFELDQTGLTYINVKITHCQSLLKAQLETPQPQLVDCLVDGRFLSSARFSTDIRLSQGKMAYFLGGMMSPGGRSSPGGILSWWQVVSGRIV